MRSENRPTELADALAENTPEDRFLARLLKAAEEWSKNSKGGER